MTTASQMRALAAVLCTALLTALLPALIGQAHADGTSIRIAPEIAADTAVNHGQWLTVSGTTNPAYRVQAARLVGTRQGGSTVERSVDPAVLNVGEDGTLSGRVTPGNTFAHEDMRRVFLEVTVGSAASQETVASDEVRMDNVRPFIRRHELVGPNRIRVVFSEPVRNPEGDSAEDWRFCLQPDGDGECRELPWRVVDVEGPADNDCVGGYLPGEDDTAGPTGCTRTLVVLPDLDEDATPFVHPRISDVTGAPVVGRASYRDFASNFAWMSLHGQPRSNALNLIRPPLPSIDSLDGEAPDGDNRVRGESRSPQVQVGNLRAGHSVYFKWRGSAGSKGETEPEEVTGSTHTTTLPPLGDADDVFEIEAVVIDPHGNESNEDKEKARLRQDSDRHTVLYILEEILPELPAPRVQQPADELYTPDSSVTIAGVVEPAQEDVTVQLRERHTGLVLQTDTTGGDGAWSFAESLPLDRRYQFSVGTTDGEQQHTVDVPDVIRDTVAPLVQVLRPIADPTQIIQGQLDPRPRFGEGDSVAVSWLAADLAPGDPLNPDHGDFVDIELRFADGATRTVGQGLDHALGEVRDHSYVVTSGDVQPAPREGLFHVDVTDLAGNVGSAQSVPIVIDGTLLGYGAFFVKNDPNESVIEARFPVAVAGTTTSADWRIDGTPPRSVSVQDGGRTVVLVAAQSITDPNATPEVQFTPAPVNLSPLQGADGREINRAPRLAIDAIAPVLSIVPPDPGPVNSDTVRVVGSTDETSRPNTIRAVRDGQVVAQTTASTSGTFSLTVPLAPDRLNTVAVRAVDPAGNRSPDRPFEVIEDSTPPVVRFINPETFGFMDRRTTIRWETIDANPDVVDIEYRVNQGSWQRIATATPDTGEHPWQVPSSVPDDAFVDLRITATDLARNRGEPAVAAALRLGITEFAETLRLLCDDPDPAPFVDRDRIPAVHRSSVDCLYWLDIARGSVRGGLGYFDPQNDISRGQFAAFLFRAYGVIEHELPPPRDPRFDDVHAGHAFDEDIHRLAAAAVIFGYDERRYGPADPIRRDQTASLLLRSYGITTGASTDPQSPGGYFADTAGSVHRDNIDAAFESGLVKGTVEPQPGQPGRYEPAGLTTRAQMATVIVRFLYLYAG